MKSSGIGGQAVLEGVMMKNKSCYAVAVRKPNNEIEVKKEEFAGAGERRALFKMPIFRGMATFVESLVLGMHALTYSSSFYEEEEEEHKEVSKAKETLVDVGVVAISVIMAIVVFILFPLFISNMLGKVIKSETLQLVMEGFLRLFMFIAYIALISKMNDIKRVFMYHGAEHKCINCVEQGYELTIANVKKQSKCHKRCGTSFMMVVMLVSFVLFMFIRVEAAWLRYVLRIVLIPVVAGISYEFIRLAGNTENKIIDFLSRPGLWMQGLTTKEPDDSMIEVAIASVEAVFDWRAYQEEEGIAKYRKDSFGRTGRNERLIPTVPKDRRVERPLVGSRSETKVAAVSRRKENGLTMSSAGKDEKPVAKSIGKVERPAGKSGSRAEAPITKAGMKEGKPSLKIGGAEKVMPKSGVKTIKPLVKAENKMERAAVRGGSQGEKTAAKIAPKRIKAVEEEKRELLSENGRGTGATEAQISAMDANKEILANEEIAAVEIQSAEAKKETGSKGQETVTATITEGSQAAIEDEEAVVSKEIAVEMQEIAVSEEIAREAKEITANKEAAGEAQEIVVDRETAKEAQEIAVQEEAAEEVQEIAVQEEAAEEVQEIALKEEIAEVAQEVALSKETAEEAQEIPEMEAAMEKIQNRNQDKRRTNLISFMSAPDDEEEDEILRALDRYFVYGEEDSEEKK